MRTQNAFIVWTAMVLHLSVLKGQRTDSSTDGTSTLNEVLPEYHTTPKSDSRPGTADSIVSSPPTDLSSFEVTATVSPPSQSSKDAAVQNDTSHSQTTTLNTDTASVPGSSVSSTAQHISDSEAFTAPTSISSSEGYQSVNTSASSVSQITQTAPPTYPQTSQLALTSSSKSTGPAPLEDQDEPSELDVGDQESGKVQHHPASPLDPLLAALVTIFIICTAMVSAVLFLRFRQRSEHPEFHRLQDLPMEDLLEDTPLSRYTY